MATSTREEIKVGGMAIRFLVEGHESAEAVAVFEFDVPADAKVAAAHSHDGYEETIYGLEGVLTWTVEGMATDVGPGEALFIPRGAVHRFENTGGADARALAIVTPGILGPDYFREAAASSTPRPGPAGPCGDRDGDAAPRSHARTLRLSRPLRGEGGRRYRRRPHTHRRRKVRGYLPMPRQGRHRCRG